MFDQKTSHYVNFNLYNNFPYKAVQFIGSDSAIMIPFLFKMPLIIASNAENDAKIALTVSIVIYLYNNLYVTLYFLYLFITEYICGYRFNNIIIDANATENNTIIAKPSPSGRICHV